MAVAFAIGEQVAPRGIAIGVLALVNRPGFRDGEKTERKGSGQ